MSTLHYSPCDKVIRSSSVTSSLSSSLSSVFFTWTILCIIATVWRVDHLYTCSDSLNDRQIKTLCPIIWKWLYTTCLSHCMHAHYTHTNTYMSFQVGAWQQSWCKSSKPFLHHWQVNLTTAKEQELHTSCYSNTIKDTSVTVTWSPGLSCLVVSPLQ